MEILNLPFETLDWATVERFIGPKLFIVD